MVPPDDRRILSKELTNINAIEIGITTIIKAKITLVKKAFKEGVIILLILISFVSFSCLSSVRKTGIRLPALFNNVVKRCRPTPPSERQRLSLSCPN